MSNVVKDALETEVSEARRTIASDGYPMSIGELTNLYRDRELIIRPEFQRYFRWTQTQKSRLIESLLLGIPLPSIFVSQQAEGKWELVDGLQRVSTILQLQGELRDENEETVEPLVLAGTKYLRSLEGRQWDGADEATSLSPALKLDVKRSKVDVKIIKRESSPETKYDLFQRLNSYGSTLTAQELRSALLVAVSPGFVAWIEQLATYPAFTNSVHLHSTLVEQRYDLELVLRFLILHNQPASAFKQSNLRDFGQFLDDASIALAGTHPNNASSLAEVFHTTFDTVAANGGRNVFRKWHRKRKEYTGSFLNTAFEVFALGLGHHIANGTSYRSDLEKLTKLFWARPETRQGYATGRSTEARLTEFVPLGRRITAAARKR